MNLAQPFDSNKQAFTTSKFQISDTSICKQVWTMPTEDKKSKNQKFIYKILKNRGLEKTYLHHFQRVVDRAVMRRHRVLLIAHRRWHRFLLYMHMRWNRVFPTAHTWFPINVQNIISQDGSNLKRSDDINSKPNQVRWQISLK